MINKLLPKLHKEGYRFLAIGLIITFLLIIFSKFLSAISLILTIWIYYFFRDPERFSINDNRFLVSPADGVISKITETNGPKELGLDEKKYTRVSVFMNVFNCHVNRSPLSAKVEDIVYRKGKFFNASLDKASIYNESNFIKFVEKEKEEIIVVQIAGLIARRIVCEIEKENQLKQGDTFGIIRFGSRVDLYFNNYKLLVKENQNVIAGETLIAEK